MLHPGRQGVTPAGHMMQKFNNTETAGRSASSNAAAQPTVLGELRPVIAPLPRRVVARSAQRPTLHSSVHGLTCNHTSNIGSQDNCA